MRQWSGRCGPGRLAIYLKEAEELCRAIKAAAAGQVQLSPKAATRLLREIRAPESLETFTEREMEVLKALAQGQSNKEIAHHLVISEKTVKTHVTHILNKLQVPSRTQAALYAIRIGLVLLDASDEANTSTWKDS
jgi:two-component system, NarL family, response regulator LiaR